MAFLEFNGGNIFYEVYGEGPSLIFLHGGGGNATSWYRQIPFFSKQYKCVVIDNRGFGRSYPYGPDVMNVAGYADDVFAIMDELEIQSAGLVCQSMGAWTGLRMAMKCPDRVWALATSSSPMGVNYPPAFQDAMDLLKSLSDSDLAIEEAALSKNFRENNPEDFWLYRHTNLFNTGALRGDDLGIPPQAIIASMFSPDIAIQPDQLADVKVPTLLMGGEEDLLVKPSTPTAFAEYFGNAKLKIFTNSGHSPYVEVPTEFNECVSEFLSDAQTA
ncbi:MAG: alpha/beta hydrolase [Cyanobacteria bacterium J06642_2]